MIINHKYNFVYIKTRKTASSSVEIALSRLCRKGDVVSGLMAEEEAARRAEGGYGPARFWKPLYRYSFKEISKRVRRGKMAKRFGNHAGLATAQRLVETQVWRGLLRVTSERNPWDKALSRYYWDKARWRNKGKRTNWTSFPRFRDYLLYIESNKPERLSCWDLYTLDGRVAVDRFLFFESLVDDMAALGEVLGLEQPLRLPEYRAKSGGDRPSGDYRRAYGSEEAEIVGRLFRREIQYFGYVFERPGQPPACMDGVCAEKQKPALLRPSRKRNSSGCTVAGR